MIHKNYYRGMIVVILCTVYLIIIFSGVMEFASRFGFFTLGTAEFVGVSVSLAIAFLAVMLFYKLVLPIADGQGKQWAQRQKDSGICVTSSMLAFIISVFNMLLSVSAFLGIADRLSIFPVSDTTFMTGTISGTVGGMIAMCLSCRKDTSDNGTGSDTVSRNSLG